MSAINWEKKEGMGRIVKMGDAPDQLLEFEGLFLGSMASPKYGAERPLHNFRTSVEEGDELVSIPSNSALDRKLSNADAGKLVKIKFLGWQTTKLGRQVKDFEVFTYGGESTPAIMANYPRYMKVARPAPLEVTPKALTVEDEELPF